ncbi:hypothetical protein MBANPS3_002796 [Mucor bainieri]
MTKNNPKTINTIEFDHHDPAEEGSSDGRKRKEHPQESAKASKKQKGKEKEDENAVQSRGKMTANRNLELCLAYKDIRPDGVPYKQRSTYWKQVTDRVNNVDCEKETPVEWKTVQKRMASRFDMYRYKFTEDYHNKSTGTTRPEVPAHRDLERRVYDTWKAKEEDKNKSKGEREKKRLNAEVSRQALKGFKAKMDGNKPDDEESNGGRDRNERKATIVPEVAHKEESSSFSDEDDLDL